MATTDPFAELGPQLQRDRYGRPLVTPPDGGKPVPYTRCTTFVSATEDTYNLSLWSQRQVAVGLASRPDLIGLVAASKHDKKALNDVVKQAHDAAASDSAANTGTAIHQFAEQLDRGQIALADVPEQYRDDLAAYLDVTAGWTHRHIEEFMVLDEFKIGGTPDRLSVLPDGRLVVADIKTGGIDFGMGKIAGQIAAYAHSLLYDIGTGMRHPIEVDRKTGIVIHVPAGTGTARLVEVDLEAGWDNVQLCAQVREWRARKNLARDYINPVAGMQPVVDDTPTHADTIMAEIAACDDVEQLNGVYALHMGTWKDIHTEAATQRKAALIGGAA